MPFNLTKPKPKLFKEPIKISNKLEIKEISYEKLNETSLSKIENNHQLVKEKIREVGIS